MIGWNNVVNVGHNNGDDYGSINGCPGQIGWNNVNLGNIGNGMGNNYGNINTGNINGWPGQIGWNNVNNIGNGGWPDSKKKKKGGWWRKR